MSDVLRDKNMAVKIAKEVDKLGGRTFYVGGYVRDQLLNKENKDIDIEIHGITFNQLHDILTGLGHLDERKVGDHFGVLALRGYDIDIAMPRSEKPSEGGGHKGFIIDVDPFIGYKQAAKRRDLTINALMQDVLTGEVIDSFNGVNDLKNGVIRHVDSQTFIDDPLRVLRVAQFAARFNFKVAPETIELAKTMDLSKLSHERVAGELTKALMKSDNPSVFFKALDKMNQLDTWFPEVKALKGVKQEAAHHPEGDVFNHTMLVLDEAAKYRSEAKEPLYFMVAALCHDFGKPSATVYNTEKQKWQSLEHDIIGAPIAEKFVDRVYHANSMAKYVTEMTEYHMKPLMMYNVKSSQKKFMHLFDEVMYPEDLILIAKADNNGRLLQRPFDEAEIYLREKLEDYRELMAKPQVTGQDLISLGYKPGPMFTEMLAYTHKTHLAGVSKEESIRHMMGMFGLSERAKIKKNKVSERGNAVDDIKSADIDLEKE